MKLCLLFTCFLLFCNVPLFACTVIDDTGQRLTLSQPARRIITLSPDLTEFVYVLGAGPALVGVLAGSDYPADAKKRPVVGDYRALNVETILRLQPDLILAWGESHRQQVAALKKFSIPVYLSHARHLREIPHTLRRLGCLTGQEAQAKRLADAFSERYRRLERQYQRATRFRVFYQLAFQPLMTVNQKSWINDAITLCGGENIFSETALTGLAQATAFAVSREAVLKANPELIVADLPDGWQQAWQPWSALTAVQQQHLVTMNPDLLARPGPRILDGVEALCRIIAALIVPVPALLSGKSAS